MGRSSNRFVFKTFSEQINEIDIKVFRSLDKVKAEPSKGSTFFKDCLLEWRERNTAAHFILFYEEVLPCVQTLPLIILQNELIFSKLISGLHMEAVWSLEAFLSLIAALSRDLLEDFLPFLPRIVNSLVSLLKKGCQKKPETIKQIFESWSYIVRDLQKYLICDIEGILRDTLELRYYPKDDISGFMSPSISFLLRTARAGQREKGIKRILSEVADPPNRAGAVGVLYYVMRGTDEKLHSKSDCVLRFLLKDSTLSLCDNFPQESGSTIEVVSSTLQRICEDYKVEELSVIWNCLYQEINKSILNKNSVHLSRLLTVLTSAVRIKKGLKVHDYPSLIGIVSQIVSTLMPSSEIVVFDQVLRLILCTIDKPMSVSEMESIASQWAPIFSLKSSSLLAFLGELIKKDQSIVKAFTNNILSAINNMIRGSSEEVIPLLLSLSDKQQQSHNIINEEFESGYERIHEFLEENIKKIQKNIENTGLSQIDEAELATVCRVVKCYPYFKVDSSLLICLKNTLRQHLAVPVENTLSAPVLMWQSLLGTSLRSCHKLCSPEGINHNDLEEALCLAKCYKSCVQVLSPVADYLDFVDRPLLANDDSSKTYPELRANKAEEAFDIFSENLRHSNKDVRLLTLRILCHFETLSSNPSSEEHHPKKKLKTEETPKSLPEANVLQLLHKVEKSPLTVSTAVELCGIHEAYVPLVFNGIIGLFHNRNSKAQVPPSECLAVLLEKHTGAVWNDFVRYLGQCQVKFKAPHNHSDQSENCSISEKYTDLIGSSNSRLFPPSDSTPIATVVSLLLQTLQKVPNVAQSRASEILPLLLEFLGYNSENPERVGLFYAGACKGEEWKQLLIHWLTLLKLMNNRKSLRLSQFVNDVLQYRFLDDNDAEIQKNVLECLLLWNDYLVPYSKHLENLIKSDELREELATWNFAKDIEEAHRPHLVSLVIRILMPKVTKLKNSASRKHTESIRHRKAVLCFLAQLDVSEISLFFALLMKPLNIIPEEAMDLFCSSGKSSLDCFQRANLLKYFNAETISTLSREKKSGFLHVIENILEVFDVFHVRPFLDFLMGCVVRILVNYAPSIDEEMNIDKGIVSTHHNQAGTSLKQYKEFRSLCLKIFAHVLDKYDDSGFGSEFWDLFFSAVNPLIKSFKQEGSSSEKPSSLFKCFLSMSKSCNLVTFLCREEFLIPDIFSILTVTTASKAVKSSALKFIENLLSLDNELDDDENMIKGFLDPYIEALINSLHSFFLGDRKSAKHHGNGEIKILKLLLKHIRDGPHVLKYLDVLLSFLDKSVKVKDSDIHRKALLAIQSITSLLGTESTSKIIKKVSPLLVDAGIDVRLCICDLLESLAKIDFSLDHVAKCVRDMNAISPMEVDELDYEKIIDAYGTIDAYFFHKSWEQHVMIILSQSLYNISSEELTLKDSAHNLLCAFVDFSASVLSQEASVHSDIGKEVVKSDASWTGNRVLWIMNKFILKHIGDAINRGTSSGKGEILLIRKMVVKLPDAGNLAAFRPLCSENDEVDFFKNIFSIQARHRANAIKRFTKVINDSSLPEGEVSNILVSVFFNMLLDGKSQNVQDACKEALAAVSTHMNWTLYYALLNRCFHEMSTHTSKRELMLQLIDLILNNFHFSKDGYTQEAADISTFIEKTVFPKIQKLMSSDYDSVSVYSYVVAVRILKLLPREIMDSYLDSIVPKISVFLRNKDEKIRDKARNALAVCLKALGLEYLQLVVKTLCSRFKSGYQVRELGYNVNDILSKCLSTPTGWKLDHCFGDLLAVVKTDIFEDVDEQKKERKSVSKKKKEKITCKSLETLKLIAENVTFRSHVLKLLSPVSAQLERPLTTKLKSKLEEMLKYIAAGIETNPSVDQGDLFCFIYDRLDNNRSGLGDEASSPSSKKKRKSRDLHNTAGAKSCPQLITLFGLNLLHSRLKKLNVNNTTNEELVSKLDPFVKLLLGCLSSKYEDVVSSSLRCFTALIRLQLPSFKSEAGKVITAALTITQSAVSSSSPLVQSCLKFLTALLGSGNFTFSSRQLKMMIEFPMFVDLVSDSNLDSTVTSLSLLKTIMRKKLEVPKIYDIVNQVREVMIITSSEPIRKHCRDLLLDFLVHYPLSKKCIEGHVDFLLKSLSYEHPTGREAVLDMLQALIEKWKSSKSNLLDKLSHNLFLHLAHRLANDDAEKVLSKSGVVIKLLICRISNVKVNSSLKFFRGWYKQENTRAIAAQVLGLVIEAREKNFPRHICNDILLQEAKMILESALQLQEEGSIRLWKEAYYSLVMIEKMLHQFPDLTFGKDLEDIWKMVFKLLLYPHECLRTITCRLLNYYFKKLDGRERGKSQKLVADSLLEKPSSMFMVAVSLCIQLKDLRSTDNENDGDDDITENIVFAVSGLHSMIGQCDHEFWSSLENDEQAVFFSAFEQLDSGKGRSTFLALTSGKHSEDDVRNVLIGSLLKRMGKMALDMDSIQMRIVFNVYKDFASKLNQEEFRPYAFRILLPLYKVCQGYTGKVISDEELKHLAEEVRDSIRDKSLGSQVFVQVYTEIKKSLEAKREKRKREEKLMAVINPERNAKRKLKLAAKNKANKKRRIMSSEMFRWARS